MVDWFDQNKYEKKNAAVKKDFGPRLNFFGFRLPEKEEAVARTTTTVLVY